MASPSEILGLFTSPQQYQQQQQDVARQRAIEYAKLDPFQKASAAIGQGAYGLAGAIGGALGGVDPQLQKITQRQQMLSQLDQSNPESFMQVARMAAQNGDPEFAMTIADAGRQMQSNLLTQRKTTAEAEKAELSLTQEQNLRDELSKLPPNSTEADILSIVTKYGSPDKVLSALQQSADRRTQIESKLEIELQKIEAKKESDLQRAKDEKEREQIRADARRDAAQIAADARKDIAKLAGALRQPPAPTLTTIVNPENPNETITVDARIYKGGGKNAAGVIGAGKPSAAQEKSTLLKQQLSKDLDFAINELTEVTKDGGLIDKSTGSGAGRLVDLGAAFVGTATPGAIAIGQLKPIQDLVLKMVPRFEGPQSDKDTQSYKEAAGQLADPTLPTETRKAAGKTVLRLMKERKNQFVTPELASEGIGASPSTVQMTKEDQQALDWANSNPNDPRSSQIKSRLGVR
jgi:hypothetical protein